MIARCLEGLIRAVERNAFNWEAFVVAGDAKEATWPTPFSSRLQ
jgi:hypothetical protein